MVDLEQIETVVYGVAGVAVVAAQFFGAVTGRQDVVLSAAMVVIVFHLLVTLVKKSVDRRS